jgi:hypothetical protein
MNAAANGSAQGLLQFNPFDRAFTLFKPPAGALIGWGQAGKSAIRSAARGFVVFPAAQTIVAPASKSNPTVTDAGLVVFRFDGSARIIPLPSNVARLHAPDVPFLKTATNKVFILGESTAAATGTADLVVWFDLSANTSGTLAPPSQVTALLTLDYEATTGMAIATCNPEAKGYVVWQLP